jgi:ferric-dicitrate binding protein FerR (iron transport regulator)
LGTAFSIKANPADPVITVTVTRGKVKVEDDKTLLAMLEADKQLVYNTKTNRVSEKTVDAGLASDWRSHNLIFRNSSFESIIQEISTIYDVTIVFEDESLSQRQITASLDDRDAIATILNILCTAQRAYYIMEGETYVIKSLKE